MKQIRLGVFETNSSSVHSITIMDRDIFDEWRESGLYLGYNDDDELVLFTREELIAHLGDTYQKEKDWYDNERWLFRDYGWSTWREYGEDYSVKWIGYTTKHGDDVVAVSYYGYD